MGVRWLSKASLSGFTLCAAGCAGHFDPPSFQGSREPQRAEAEAVGVVAVRTTEMVTLGSARASCRSRSSFLLAGEPLSDVDCSTERLLAALREVAASAGGELLVGAQCGSSLIEAAPHQTEARRCTAGVARYVTGPSARLRPLSVPRSGAPGRPAPSASDVKRIDEPDVSLSFRISVTFQPATATAERPPLRGDQVRELPRMPLADQSLGDLSASCADACDERALRYGVLLAAGRLGVRDVVGVRCYQAGSGNACVGTLAAPELRE